MQQKCHVNPLDKTHRTRLRPLSPAHPSPRRLSLAIVRRTAGPTGQSHPENRNLEGHGVYFEIWDRSGTYYRFGYNWDSEHLRGQQHHLSAWGLAVDRVESPIRPH